MKYQNIDTKEIISYRKLKLNNPNVAIPRDGTPEIMNYRVVSKVGQPQYDNNTQQIREVEPVNYMQTWEVTPLSDEQIANNLQRHKDKKIATLNKATKESIETLASVDKQRNHLAKYNELLNKKLDGTITTEEETTMTTLETLWTSIETLVSEGNIKTDAVQAATSFSAVDTMYP